MAKPFSKKGSTGGADSKSGVGCVEETVGYLGLETRSNFKLLHILGAHHLLCGTS